MTTHKQEADNDIDRVDRSVIVRDLVSSSNGLPQEVWGRNELNSITYNNTCLVLLLLLLLLLLFDVPY
jgi:hypothetical protein